MLLVITFFVSTGTICPGQNCLDYPYTTYSAFIGGTVQEIALMRIGNVQQNELIGLWQANMSEFKTYSQISFDENGQIQEKVYSELSSELLATYEGRYTATKNLLLVTLNSGESYRFFYTHSEDYLKISQFPIGDAEIQ